MWIIQRAICQEKSESDREKEERSTRRGTSQVAVQSEPPICRLELVLISRMPRRQKETNAMRSKVASDVCDGRRHITSRCHDIERRCADASQWL